MDEKTGKMQDVLIEDNYTKDETGLSTLSRSVDVWADAGMIEVIKKVEGVTNVFKDLCETKYNVYLDPRYNHNFLKKEIEAAIKCK